MNLKERIRELCKQNNISMSKVETDLNFANGYISKLGKSTPNAMKIQQLADYFSVSIDYLMDTEKKENLSKKPPRDIIAILNSTREQLMSQEGLMFDGEPATPEAVDSILSAMEIGMEMARRKNQEKYTPKKHKKE